MARTKIVATIGPASSDSETIGKLLDAGMNVARINFSHGDHETVEKTVATLRQVAQKKKVTLAILGDLQGPKIRLGHVKPGGINLSLRDEVILTPHPGQPAMIHLPHPDLIEAVQPGDHLVIGDGEVELIVTEKVDDLLKCEVVVAGLLEARKGINAPGTKLSISAITEKDEADLIVACRLNFDFIALSFVRTAVDIYHLRRLIHNTGKKIPIIAKIEKMEAIDHLEGILEASDGLMVARGDLGIEVQPQKVPMLQKKIIRSCNNAGIPVITATQMLQSMVEHPRPTRAEASDVANAILDGTDAVMLSGETATGRFPVEAVEMMSQIGDITERDIRYDAFRTSGDDVASGSVTQAISTASCAISEIISAAAIVSATMSGYTARQISRHRPRMRIIAVTPLPETQRQLALSWGVESYLVSDFSETEVMLEQTVQALKSTGFNPGDRIVITAGIPFGAKGHTNLIRVHEIQ